MFDSMARLRATLEGQVATLAKKGDIGLFITALCNALVIPGLFVQRQDALREGYQQLSDLTRQRILAGETIPGPPDDVLVWLKLMAIGWENLTPVERRQAGPWSVQYNLLRSMRPCRMASRRIRRLHVPFEVNGFHFCSPRIQAEFISEPVVIAGTLTHVVFNRYPFSPRHLLLLPDRDGQHSQFLADITIIEWVWKANAWLAERLPHVAIGYNSLGAYGSINHLHFQLVLEEIPLPVTRSEWLHNGGTEKYPAHLLVCGTPEETWMMVNRLQQTNIPFNLLFVPGCAYVFPRKFQDACRHSEWTTGFAFFELAGGLIATSRRHYDVLVPKAIEREFEVVRSRRHGRSIQG